MSSAVCTVCGRQVLVSKNLISEHTVNGRVCYGSFLPNQPPKLFTPKGGVWYSEPIIAHWHEPEPLGDDSSFVEELNNL